MIDINESSQVVFPKEYYRPGRKWDGGVSTVYEFKNGKIELLNGNVIGGDVDYKDSNTKINIYVFNGDLSVFRPSSDLYKTQGYTTRKGMLINCKSMNRNKIESALKKTYNKPHVDEFMELARSIFYSQDLDKQFDFRNGEYIGDR